jgi:ABC-type protease/lipase transport system fused ATPase/permease subunit
VPKTLAIPDAAVIHRPVPERVMDVEELRFSCDQTEVLHGLTFQLSGGEVLGLL